MYAGAAAALIVVAGIAYMLGGAGSGQNTAATAGAPVSAANTLLGAESAGAPQSGAVPTIAALTAPSTVQPSAQPPPQAFAQPAAEQPSTPTTLSRAPLAAPTDAPPRGAAREQGTPVSLFGNLRPAQQDAQSARRDADRRDADRRDADRRDADRRDADRRDADRARAVAQRTPSSNSLIANDDGRAAGASRRPDAATAVAPAPAPAALTAPPLRFMFGDWEYRGTEAGESIHVLWRLTDDGRARYLVNPGKPNVFATEGSWTYDDGKLSESYANGTSATTEVRMISRNELELRIIDNGDARAGNVRRRFQRR